jgi:lipoate-protein ligase A
MPFPSSPTFPSFYLWIDELPRPGYANMAIDQSLLDRAEQHGESWLRLYQWNPYCLSFGRHEPATRRYDVRRIEALSLDTVRRPTGGRAVWHARELTYAVAAPSARFGSLNAAYLEIHRMLSDALDRLGAHVFLAPSVPGSALDAGACFARPAGGELIAGQRKVVGSAQYRQGAALLQHGSILLQDDQQMVLSVARSAIPRDGGDPDSAAGGLDQAVGRRLALPEVAEAIATAARARWPGNWTLIPSPPQVLDAAANYHQQYRSPAWTWAR